MSHKKAKTVTLMRFCPKCETTNDVTELPSSEDETYTIKYKHKRYTVQVRYFRCNVCSTEFEVDETVKA